MSENLKKLPLRTSSGTSSSKELPSELKMFILKGWMGGPDKNEQCYFVLSFLALTPPRDIQSHYSTTVLLHQ